jgi:hypothetical protein
LAGRTRKMVNLAIEETSGVDHPAHLHEGWLVMKSADESEVQRVLDETLTEEDSIMEDTTTAATDAQVEKAEMTMEDAMKKIAELEGKLSEMEMSKESMPESESDKTEDDDKMEYMKSAPESVVKMIEDFKKQAETATEELRKEREAKADADAIEKAKGYTNLNLEAEKIGPALRRLSAVDSELAKSVEDILTAVNAQAESANIFAEIGKSADFTSGDAYGRMTAMAKSAVEDGSANTFEQAFASVASQNPELYVQYRNEKGAK